MRNEALFCFRGSSGMVMREGSVFVILLYPVIDKRSGTRIEEIRESYRNTFELGIGVRVDDESCVSF